MRNQGRKLPHPLDDFVDDIELPPLDNEECQSLDIDTLADFLDSNLETKWDESVSEKNEADPAELLCDFETTSIAEDDEEENDLLFDSHIDVEEESSWTDSDIEDPKLEQSDWFFSSEGDDGKTMDDGAEGPSQKESIEIDERCFAPLDEETENDDKDVIDTMRRLGLMDEHLTGIADDAANGSVLGCVDASYLGPVDGQVAQAAFMGASPVAVGHGVCVLGADDMLHAVAGEKPFDLNATSVAYYKGALFIGTGSRGAYLSTDLGKTLIPINGWYDEGLGQKSLVIDISTSFTILGQTLTNGEYRLCGRTGEGQLYYSPDRGASWRGPVWKGCCLTLAPVHGTNSLLALFKSHSGELALVTSDDMVFWRAVDLPPQILARLSLGPVTLAACEGSVLIGVGGQRGGLLRSLDFAETFDVVSGVSDVSALAVDPEDPEWMAVAVSDRARGLATVRISDDSGKSWRTALRVDLTSNRAPRSAPATYGITGLCARGGALERRILATTGHGVYLVMMSRGGFAH